MSRSILHPDTVPAYQHILPACTPGLVPERLSKHYQGVVPAHPRALRTPPAKSIANIRIPGTNCTATLRVCL
eukprot:1143237-Rhodomonas_salina.1